LKSARSEGIGNTMHYDRERFGIQGTLGVPIANSYRPTHEMADGVFAGEDLSVQAAHEQHKAA